MYVEHDQDYTPGGPIIGKGEQYLVALHLTRPLNGGVTLTNITKESIYIPETAFIAGGIYNYPIIKISYENPELDDKSFLGLRFATQKKDVIQRQPQ